MMSQIAVRASHSKQQETINIQDLIDKYNNNPDLYRIKGTINLLTVVTTIINNIDIFLESSFWLNKCNGTLYPYEKIIILSIINKLQNRIEYLLMNTIFRKKVYSLIENDYNAIFNTLITCTEPVLLRFIKYMKVESPYFGKFVNRFIKEYSTINKGYSQIYEVVFYNMRDWIIPYSDHVRANVKKDNWRRVWWLYIILRIRMREFIWRYYAPPHGRGYLKALNSWNTKIKIGK
jgi:hypothetical protein